MGPYGLLLFQDLAGQVNIFPTPEQKSQWFIGGGVYTNVFKGEHHPVMKFRMVNVRPIFVTVKILHLPSHDKEEWEIATKCLIRESSILHHLKHPNILPYLGHCSGLAPLPALVSLYCENGTIMKYIVNQPSSKKPQLVKEVANGLMYLHSQDVIHCNLQPVIEFIQCQNHVLVDEQGHAVLTGFSRAKVIGIAGYSNPLVVGATAYMAPELFPLADVDVDNLFSKKSDIYAFGMLYFDISYMFH
ncbi:hypothetical protein PILCRDRAFT_90158 [Piloderma croceum F 1598]|uniref:Protein kinase domain-containing protein n=1 Tax=Piloderma croceum (strain F 1598) TaxID=765440 RepID=A0A0C3F3A5_PILCF|nr:hypothetical protein PILCRDRAFT_90158 [Piloderma croceum F 1598]